MRKINNLNFADSLLIWILRQLRSQNPQRRYQVSVLFNRILNNNTAKAAKISFDTIVNILPKSEKSKLLSKNISDEEEKILSIIYLIDYSNEEIAKNKILNSLYIKEEYKKLFINKIIELKNLLYNSHKCLFKNELNNINYQLSNLNNFELKIINSLRIWFKALQEDLDTFGMLYKYHLKKNDTKITISFHSLIEKIVLNKSENIEVNCIFCKKLTQDELAFIKLIKLAINNNWSGCEKILRNDFRIDKSLKCILLLKQLIASLMTSEIANASKINKSSQYDYLNKKIESEVNNKIIN